MLKIPVCPCCGRKFKYKEIIKLTNNKIIKCKKCKNNIKISKIFGKIKLLLFVIIMLVFVNIYLISNFEFKGILPMLIINIICVSLSLLLMPFTVRFKKVNNDRRR